MYWLTGKSSKLKKDNKLLIYKYVIKPIWIDGIELCGIAAEGHIAKVKTL